MCYPKQYQIIQEAVTELTCINTKITYIMLRNVSMVTNKTACILQNTDHIYNLVNEDVLTQT